MPVLAFERLFRSPLRVSHIDWERSLFSLATNVQLCRMAVARSDLPDRIASLALRQAYRMRNVEVVDVLLNAIPRACAVTAVYLMTVDEPTRAYVYDTALRRVGLTDAEVRTALYFAACRRLFPRVKSLFAYNAAAAHAGVRDALVAVARRKRCVIEGLTYGAWRNESVSRPLIEFLARRVDFDGLNDALKACSGWKCNEDAAAFTATTMCFAYGRSLASLENTRDTWGQGSEAVANAVRACIETDLFDDNDVADADDVTDRGDIGDYMECNNEASHHVRR